jgi:hypothetical protein
MAGSKLAVPALLALTGAAWLFPPASLSSPAAMGMIAELRHKAADATYSRWLCYTRLVERDFGRPNGCTWEEYAGNYWHRWEHGAVHRFDFPGDGTVRFVSVDFEGALPEAGLIGTPKTPWHIEWECPRPEPGGYMSMLAEREPAWVRLTDDLSSLVFTCGVAHPAAYPLARLQYSWYRRN